jgi:hypothetical protein
MRQSRRLLFSASGFVLFVNLVTAHPLSPQDFTINDPLFDQRVGIQLDLGTALNIEATKAPRWLVTHIAILDAGVESTHPDLAGQMDESLYHNFVGDNPPFRDTFGHGTGMAGLAIGITNNQKFVASPCGLGGVKGVDLRWNDGHTFSPSKVRAALEYIRARNADGSARFVSACFAYGIADDDPKATKQAVQAVAPVVLFGPPHGMIGSLSTDPAVNNVVAITSLNESGNDFDLLSGAGVDATLAVPGGVMHQLVPVVGPGGSGDGIITTGGVSQGIALASSCFAALSQWGVAADLKEALGVLKASAVQFPAGVGHVMGRIDLGAAIMFDPNAPKILDVGYALGAKKITVLGTNFGSGARVIINELDVTDLITVTGDSKIKLKGGVIRGSLHAGSNAIRVITLDGLLSNLFILTL